MRALRALLAAAAVSAFQGATGSDCSAFKCPLGSSRTSSRRSAQSGTLSIDTCCTIDEGFYQKKPFAMPTRCTRAEDCLAGLSYLAGKPCLGGGRSDSRHCATCSPKCKVGQFTFSPCKTTSDRICKTCSPECGKGYYEFRKCHRFQNRICRQCSSIRPCAKGWYEKDGYTPREIVSVLDAHQNALARLCICPCTAHRDRQCVRPTNRTVSLSASPVPNNQRIMPTPSVAAPSSNSVWSREQEASPSDSVSIPSLDGEKCSSYTCRACEDELSCRLARSFGLTTTAYCQWNKQLMSCIPIPMEIQNSNGKDNDSSAARTTTVPSPAEFCTRNTFNYTCANGLNPSCESRGKAAANAKFLSNLVQ